MNGDAKPWVVISDIDETIKESSMLSVLHYMCYVLMNRPICGMPEAFQYLAMRLTPKFFYVSAGPSLLHYCFVCFINSYYPPGRIFLASWGVGISLLINLRPALINYKSTRIDHIYQSEQSSRVLCIGDDSQEDLEVYVRADEKYPGWIERIFIRETGAWQRHSGMMELLLQSPSQKKVEFFTTAAELRARIKKLSDK